MFLKPFFHEDPTGLSGKGTRIFHHGKTLLLGVGLKGLLFDQNKRPYEINFALKHLLDREDGGKLSVKAQIKKEGDHKVVSVVTKGNLVKVLLPGQSEKMFPPIPGTDEAGRGCTRLRGLQGLDSTVGLKETKRDLKPIAEGLKSFDSLLVVLSPGKSHI